jgi:hypothetical protein
VCLRMSAASERNKRGRVCLLWPYMPKVKKSACRAVGRVKYFIWITIARCLRKSTAREAFHQSDDVSRTISAGSVAGLSGPFLYSFILFCSCRQHSCVGGRARRSSSLAATQNVRLYDVGNAICDRVANACGSDKKIKQCDWCKRGVRRGYKDALGE